MMTVMTVLAHQMEQPGQVIVDVYHQIMMVMTVMTVLAYQMVTAGQVIVDV